MVEREKHGFHYSAIPTAKYRTRFGFLSYAFKVVAIRGEDAQPQGLPKPILDAGKAELTAVIHPLSPACHFWDLRGAEPHRDFDWPSESGGQATLQKIFDRCAEMRQPGFREETKARHAKNLELLKSSRTRSVARDIMRRANLDPILSELLEPERVRQKNEMLRAIDRVCVLIQEAGSPAPAQSR